VHDAPEGVPIETLFEKKIFPVSRGYHERFPGGEGEDDLARRAQVAMRECVLPHIPYAPIPQDQYSGVHVAIASHGRAISYMVSALMMLDPQGDKEKTYFGMKNTAWTRLDIRVRVSILFASLAVEPWMFKPTPFRMATMVL